MAIVYEIPRGSTETGPMSLDYDSGFVTIRYYNAGGVEIQPTIAATISISRTMAGEDFRVIGASSSSQWTLEGPVGRLRVSLTGTGATTAAVSVWRGDDAGSGFPDGVFAGLRAITVQPYTEANVKNGLQFYARTAWPTSDTIAAGSTRKVMFRTGVKPVIVKMRDFAYISEELSISLYQGATGVSGGTSVPIRNYNLINPIATTCTMTANVTTTSDGTLFDGPEYFYGSASAPQRSQAAIPAGRERILQSSTTYIIAITASGGIGASRAQYFLDFYEGTPDLPL